MILVYTGNGKGKTCASVGQAVRAHGQGLRVAFGQFMKRPEQAGEQKALAALLGEAFCAGGQGFFRKEEERPKHRAAALALWEWAMKQARGMDMLVLDEALYALGCGILTPDELRAVMEEARASGCHLVLSGRGAPGWLEEAADFVTRMEDVRHPFAEGVTAVRGIEY